MLQCAYNLVSTFFTADNGLNPVWNETCEFDVLNPSLAMLRFNVQDEDMFGDKKFLGQATNPVTCFANNKCCY